MVGRRAERVFPAWEIPQRPRVRALVLIGGVLAGGEVLERGGGGALFTVIERNSIAELVSLELLIDSNCTQLYVITPITIGRLVQYANAVLLARTVSFLREQRLVAGELSGFSERMADSTLFSKHFKVCPFISYI